METSETHQKPTCNNCQSEDFVPFAKTKCFMTKYPLQAVQCNRCGLVFLFPKPPKELGEKYFENAYQGNAGLENHPYYRDHDNILSRNRDRMNRLLPCPSPNQKILDFGAGQGHFVKVSSEYGRQCKGIEPSPSARESANSLFQIDLLADLQQIRENDFGIITLWDVIEHLDDPRETLKVLSGYLHKDGLFVIETSNIDSLAYRIHKNKWSYWHVDHKYYYSKDTLAYLLKSLHFTLLDPATIKGEETQGVPEKPKRLKIDRRLLNPKSYIPTIKKRLILKRNKNIDRNSIFTLYARRTLEKTP